MIIAAGRRCHWTPDSAHAGGVGTEAASAGDGLDAPPDIYLAMQQQLGLKIENWVWGLGIWD